MNSELYQNAKKRTNVMNQMRASKLVGAKKSLAGQMSSGTRGLESGKRVITRAPSPSIGTRLGKGVKKALKMFK